MSSLPSSARAVVIGCGIVGNSVAYHLTRLGWDGVVLMDKGPLPNPGGSTGHASNFIYLVDHAREMTALTVESVRQYREMGVFTECGGVEVARTPQRMQELTRRVASARSWGIEPVRLVTPAEIEELVPYIDGSILLGGFYTPGVGVVDSLRAGTIMRERAQASGALQVAANTEVLGIDVECGQVRRVRTTNGDVEAETVVIACGVWSPRVRKAIHESHRENTNSSPPQLVHLLMSGKVVPRSRTSYGRFAATSPAMRRPMSPPIPA